MVKITFYVTTYAATLKARTDIVKIRHLLDVHKRKLGIEYEEVDLSLDPYRRQEMLQGSSGIITLPQVHIDGKYLGGFEECQEFEDFGELGYLLRGEPIPHNLTGVAHHHHHQQQQELSDDEELLSDTDSSFGSGDEDEESGSEGSEAGSGESGTGSGAGGDSSSESREDSSDSGQDLQAASHSGSEHRGAAATCSSHEQREQPASLEEGWVELGREEGTEAEAAGDSDSDQAVAAAAAGLTAAGAFAGALAAVETRQADQAAAPLTEVEAEGGSPAAAAAATTAAAAASLTAAAFASALAAAEAEQRGQAAARLAELEGEAAAGSPTGAVAADLTAAAFAGALAAAAEAEQAGLAGTVPAAVGGTVGAAAAPVLRGYLEGQPAVAVAPGDQPAEESETTAVAAAEDTAALSEQLVAEALQSVLKLSS